MKIAGVALSYIFLSAMAWPQAVSVYVPPMPELVSGRVEIAVRLDGKPLKGVKVDVCKWDAMKGAGPVASSALTNDFGIAAPPELAPGEYHAVFRLEDLATLDDSRTFLYFRVLADLKTQTAVSTDLTKSVHQARLMQEAALNQAAGVPVRDHLRVFQGTVVDGAGAVLAGAKIGILKNGPQGTTFVLGLNANSTGRFSAQLPEGIYFAIFYSARFRAEAIQFEVTKEGSGDLRVALPVGEPSEIITRYSVQATEAHYACWLIRQESRLSRDKKG